MSGNTRNKNDNAASYQKTINGLQQYLANKTLNLNGKPMTTKAVVGMLQQQLADIQASASTHAAWLLATAKEHADKAALVQVLAALRHYVAALFGINSAAYLALGFPPSKAPVKSPTAKVVSAAKARATRKARNTMGSKQRLQVTGAMSPAFVVSVGTAPVAAAAEPVETVTVATPVVATPPSGGTSNR
jgi:hypothetical protein